MLSLKTFDRAIASRVRNLTQPLTVSPRRQGRKPRSLMTETLEERLVFSTTVFSDTFETNVFDDTKWAYVENATIDNVAVSEPTAPYAARLNGNTGTGDRLESTVIDLSGQSGATLSFYFQRGGGGNPTEARDDLVVQFRNAAGNWVEVDRKLGFGPTIYEFGQAAVKLPAEALHSQFQFRLMTEGRSGANDLDDWFVDNVQVTVAGNASGDVFSASQTQTDNLFFPNLLTFEFTDVPTPTGDATLVITAVGDLGNGLENLELRIDGQLIDHIFIKGGVDGGISTLTIVIPQSLMETFAADGSISMTLRPSASVSNTGASSVTLDLSYSGIPINTDTDPPVVQSVQLDGDGKTIVVQMNDDDLDPAAAGDTINYRLIRANGDANGDGDPFNDGDETEVALASVQYDSERDRIHAEAVSQLFGDHYRLTIDGDGAASDGSGGVTDLAGNYLARGDFTAQFDRTASTLIGQLKTEMENLNLPRRLQNYLIRPLDIALKLADNPRGTTRTLALFVKIYTQRLNLAFHRGAIDEADRDRLMGQAEQIFTGLQETQGEHKGGHQGDRRWDAWMRRQYRGR